MAVLLPLVGGAAPQASRQWADFRARRDRLVDQMEMSACDGCDGCGARCTAGFKVTRQEYDAAIAYLKTLPEDQVARVLGQDKEAPWPGAEETGATFTFCRYRDRERDNCFLYAARPTVCRLFGHTPWLPCPIEKVSRVPDGSVELWDRYSSFERHTWEEWDRLLAEEHK